MPSPRGRLVLARRRVRRVVVSLLWAACLAASGVWAAPPPSQPAAASPPSLEPLLDRVPRLVATDAAGRYLATACGSEAAVYELASGRRLRRLASPDHQDITCLAITPDGRFLAAGHDDGAVDLWDVFAETLLRTLWGHAGDVRAVAFRPDGAVLATAGSDNLAATWDVPGGLQRRLFRGHTETIRSIAWSGDGRHLLTGAWDKTVILWDAENARPQQTLQGHRDSVDTLAVLADGRRAVTASWTYRPKDSDWTSQVLLWDLQRGTLLKTLYDGLGLCHVLPTSAGGTRALVLRRHRSSRPSELALWEADGTPAASFALAGEAQWAAWAGDQIVVDSAEGLAALLSAQNGRTLRTLPGRLVVTGYSRYAAALSANGGRLAVGGAPGEVLVVDCASGHCRRPIARPQSRYSGPALSGDGKVLFCQRADASNAPPRLARIDLAGGAEVWAVEACPAGDYVRNMQASGDGSAVLGCWAEKAAAVWDGATGKQMRAWTADEYIYVSALSADGQQAALAWYGGGGIWNTATGHRTAGLKFEGAGQALAFSPDGRTLAVAAGRNPTRINLCDPSDGRPRRELDVLAKVDVSSLVFNAAGTRLAAACRAGEVVLYDTATGARAGTLVGHEGAVELVGFLPDGLHVVTADQAAVRYWQLSSGRQRARRYQSYRSNDWLLVAPDGLFDGSEAFRQAVGWRYDKAIVAPAPALTRRHYCPDLLVKLLQGESPQVAPAGGGSPPAATIIAPAKAAPAAEAVVEVELGNRGGGFGPVHLLRNLERMQTVPAADAGKETARCTFRVSLEPGENRIVCYAESADGGTVGPPAVAVLDGPGRKASVAVEEPRPELLLQVGHAGPVTAVAWSGDRTRLLTGAEDRTVVLWDALSGRQLRSLAGHTAKVTAAAFSPDGRLALTGGEDYRGIVWDLASGRVRGVLRAPGYAVHSVAFLPDGRRALVADNEEATIFDLQSGRPQTSARGRLRMEAAALSPDGRLLATGGGDGDAAELLLWEVASGKQLRAFSGPTEPIAAVAFSHDGRLLAAGGRDKSARLWDAASGARLGVFAEKGRDGRPAGETVTALAFSGDDRHLFVGQEGGPTVWSIDSGQAVERFQTLAGSVSTALFTPDGRHVLLEGGTYDRGGTAGFFDANTGKLTRLFRGGGGEIRSAAFDPSGRLLATEGTDEQGLTLWDVASGRMLRKLAGGRVGRPTFAPQGDLLVTAGGFEAGVWDVAGGRRLRGFAPPEVRYAVSAVSPDARYVVTVPEQLESPPEVWDVRTGNKVQSLVGSAAFIWKAIFSGDGQTILTGGGDFEGPAELVVWEVASGRQKQVLRVQAGGIKDLAISPDGRTVLTLSNSDEAAVLWDLAGGEARFTLDEKVERIAMSPDGRWGVTCGGSANEVIRLWDLANAKLRHSFAGEARAASFSPDSRRLLLGFYGQAMMWDVETAAATARFRGHVGEVCTLAASDDDRRLLVGGGKSAEAAVIWDRVSGQPLVSFVGQAKAVAGVGAGKGGRLLVSAGSQWGRFSEVVLWDAQAGQPAAVLPMGDRSVERVVLSEDGWRLFVLTGRGAQVWDIASRTLARTIGGDEGYLCDATMTADGRRVLLAGEQGGSRRGGASLWDAESGQKLRSFGSYEGIYVRGEICPQGRTVFSCPKFGKGITGHLWDAESGEQLAAVGPLAEGPRSFTFSPDGRQALLVENAGTTLVDARTGRSLRKLALPPGLTNHPTFSPDGRLLAAHNDLQIIVWDIESDRLRRGFSGHTYQIQALAFLPDGKRLLSGAADGTMRVWDLERGNEIASLVSLNDGRDWLAIAPDGAFDGSAAGRAAVGWRVPGQDRPVPVDRFFADFYRAGLLAALLRGEAAAADVRLAQSLPPRLAIISPAAGVAAAAAVTIEVEALDQGGGIANLSLFQNGARVAAPGTSHREGNRLRRRFQLTLVEGPNQLRLSASNLDGSWESEPAEIVLINEKPLAKTDLFVLAAGINRYADAALNLDYAAHDAKALAELFQRRGQSLYEKTHVALLLDAEATRPRIKEALRTIAAKTSPRDTLIVFLAGHGIMIGQRYYFVPHELRKEAERLETDIAKQGLPADEISDYFGSAKALKRLLILDTCASGGALGKVVKGRSGFALRGAIERLARNQGVFTIAAAAATEEAKESTQLGHGVLTYSLLAGLKAIDQGPLAGRYVQPSGSDRVVDVMEWFAFAAGQVPRLTEKLYGAPQDIQTSTQGSGFPILPLDE